MAGKQGALFRQRIKRIQKQLEKEGAALLLSAPSKIRQHRGVEYPFRQESDLFYLTGFSGEDVALLISPTQKNPVFLCPKTDANKVVWEGKGPDLTPVARALGATVITTDRLEQEATNLLRNTDRLYYQTRSESLGNRVARSLFNLDSYSRGSYPATFVAADKLITPLRMVKSADEVAQIRHAAAITNEALYSIVPLARERVTEAEIAETLEFVFRSCGGKTAFHTIVASGKNAATLHYHHLSGRLKRGDMLLIDSGAEFNMYASDITRTLPVNGEFEPLKRIVYDTVLKAQLAAIKAIRPGVKMNAPYDAASLVLIEGLKKLGVLKGNAKSLLKAGAHRPFFPHGIGHSLGLEVHDVGELRGNNQAVLQEGMVVTIEPGLYFPKGHKKLAPCGVRIEDDILVTRKGAVILSEGFPKDPDELCHLVTTS